MDEDEMTTGAAAPQADDTATDTEEKETEATTEMPQTEAETPAPEADEEDKEETPSMEAPGSE